MAVISDIQTKYYELMEDRMHELELTVSELRTRLDEAEKPKKPALALIPESNFRRFTDGLELNFYFSTLPELLTEDHLNVEISSHPIYVIVHHHEDQSGFWVGDNKNPNPISVKYLLNELIEYFRKSREERGTNLMDSHQLGYLGILPPTRSGAYKLIGDDYIGDQYIKSNGVMIV